MTRAKHEGLWTLATLAPAVASTRLARVASDSLAGRASNWHEITRMTTEKWTAGQQSLLAGWSESWMLAMRIWLRAICTPWSFAAVEPGDRDRLARAMVAPVARRVRINARRLGLR